MSDRDGKPGRDGATGGVERARGVLRDRLGRRAGALVLGVLAVLIGRYYWRWEGTIENIAFTVGVTLAIVAALTVLTRRLIFAGVMTAGLVAIVIAVATEKRRIMNMVVHAYDLFFYLSSWSTVSFLASEHPRHVLAFALSVAGLVALGVVVCRLDATRVRRGQATLALLLASALAAYGAHAKGERRHMQFNFENLFVSSFFASWAETLETLWRGQLVEAARSAPGARFRLPEDCAPTGRMPHVILIHQESVAPPGLFSGLDYDRSLDELFRSGDGSTRPLRVETFGGASWLTEFSILAGVSTNSFGGMRQFVQTVMQGKLKDTLPEALARCGYRNVVFYPMLQNFVSNAAFYRSIGLGEIFDKTAQGAATTSERDAFYYANTLAELERHVAAARGPLFAFVQTMAAHWPYDVTYKPEVAVPGGGPGTHPEIHEYLRRLAMARIDYAWLKSELARRFPGEPILLVHYGDHQPTATRMLLGYTDETDPESLVLDPNSPGFLTYYAVDAINMALPALPDVEVLDVPYLGSLILELAGLPLSDSHRERQRLMRVCGGRYYTCPRRAEILAFHRRLMDSGLMIAR
jgi:phosphoglycerol transferase MdoB-like AlkP superfamily enzyme